MYRGRETVAPAAATEASHRGRRHRRRRRGPGAGHRRRRLRSDPGALPLGPRERVFLQSTRRSDPVWCCVRREFIPRIGMEVLVSYVDGDPDQPVVTGCVYNGDHPTPFALPRGPTASRSPSAPTGPPSPQRSAGVSSRCGVSLRRVFVGPWTKGGNSQSPWHLTLQACSSSATAKTASNRVRSEGFTGADRSASGR